MHIIVPSIFKTKIQITLQVLKNIDSVCCTNENGLCLSFSLLITWREIQDTRCSRPSLVSEDIHEQTSGKKHHYSSCTSCNDAIPKTLNLQIVKNISFNICLFDT